MKHLDLPLSDTEAEILSNDEVHAFRLRTGWIDDLGVITPAQTHMERRLLSWWEGHELLVAMDPDASWESHAAAWVRTPENKLVRLDGTSPPIHDLNAKVGVTFTAESAMAYLGFFCLFVHGDEGPFYILHDMNAGFVPEGLSNDDRARIESVFRVPKLLKTEEAVDGQTSTTYHIETLVYYSNAVFLANFKVLPGGMTEMLDDEPLFADLGDKISFKLKFDVGEADPKSKTTDEPSAET